MPPAMMTAAPVPVRSTCRPRSGRGSRSRRAGRRSPARRPPASPRTAYSGALPRSSRVPAIGGAGNSGTPPTLGVTRPARHRPSGHKLSRPPIPQGLSAHRPTAYPARPGGRPAARATGRSAREARAQAVEPAGPATAWPSGRRVYCLSSGRKHLLLKSRRRGPRDRPRSPRERGRRLRYRPVTATTVRFGSAAICLGQNRSGRNCFLLNSLVWSAKCGDVGLDDSE